MPQPFVVEKEKALIPRDRTAERRPEIISHQMIRRVHIIKGAGVEHVVAQELVGRAVKFVRAGSGCDIDLPAAGATHLGGVTSAHHLKFPYAVRRRAQVQSIECGIGISCAIQQKIICIWAIAADAHG